jgi:hypothetical protein
MRIWHVQFVTALQAILGLASLFGAYYILDRPVPDLENRLPVVWNPPKLIEPNGAGVAIKPDLMLVAIARPLFSPDRRPFKPMPAVQVQNIEPAIAPIIPQVPEVMPPPIPESIPEQQPPQVIPQFTLKGIAQDKGKKRALISLPESPDGMWVRLGEEITNWKISKVTDNTVLLTNSDQELELSLYVDNHSKMVGTTPNSP